MNKLAFILFCCMLEQSIVAMNNFAQSIRSVLAKTDLNTLLQMVGCIQLTHLKEQSYKLAADELEEYKTTVNLSSLSIGFPGDAIWARLDHYLRNIIEVEVIKKSKNDFLGNLCTRAPLFTIKTLILDHNSLSTLPDDFTSLCYLQEFSAASNNFKIFPIALYSLETLDTINMSQNPLEDINPESLAGKKELKILNLQENKLSQSKIDDLASCWVKAGKHKECLRLTE